MRTIYPVVNSEIEELRNVFAAKVESILLSTMDHVREVWQSEHPKRTLRFVEGMGTQFWTIDGRNIDHDPKWNNDRARRVLQPLADAIDWYCEQSDQQLRLGIGDLPR